MQKSEKTPLIEVKELDLYFGMFHALKNVSVSFNAGELIGLVGDNGAGKTTLIRVLCGIHEPSRGEVYFDGQRAPNSIRSSPSSSASRPSSRLSGFATISRSRATSIWAASR